ERDTEDDVAGALARLHRALAGLAVAREVVAVVAEGEERVEVGVAFEEDRAALAAVAAVGPAARLVLGPAEVGRARPALPAADGDGDVIDELHGFRTAEGVMRDEQRARGW